MKFSRTTRSSDVVGANHLHRELHEADLDISDLRSLSRLIDKKIKVLKTPIVTPKLDLKSDPLPLPEIYGGGVCSVLSHHSHKAIRFDFNCLYAVTYREFGLNRRSRIGTWIDRARPEDCFNANLADFLLLQKDESFLPTDLDGIELICAATIYWDLSGAKWVRAAYQNSQKWDWGWVNLQERVSARNYRIAMFKKDDPSRVIIESAI